MIWASLNFPLISPTPSEVLVKRFMTMSIVLVLFYGLGTCAIADEKPAKTKKVEVKDITLNVPEGWKQKESTSTMRVGEFEIPPAGDDKTPSEFVVFYFGKQGAGGVEDNIKRWVGQVEEEGRKVRIVTGDSTLGKYTLVDLAGAYNKSIGPPIAKKSKRLAGWRVINVMLETDSGSYFLKLDGPEKTIAAVENDLRTAFGAKKDSEKEQKTK